MHVLLTTILLLTDCFPRCSPIAEHSPAESPAPRQAASGFAGAANPSGFVASGAETPPPNACTPGPARETPRSPDIAGRPTMRNTPDRLPPTAGRAPRTFPERTSPAPANSPSRTRSYLFPGHCPYKSETPAGAHRAAPAVPAPPSDPAKSASSPPAPEYRSAAAPSLHRRFLRSAQTSAPAQKPARAEIPGRRPDTPQPFPTRIFRAAALSETKSESRRTQRCAPSRAGTTQPRRQIAPRCTRRQQTPHRLRAPRASSAAPPASPHRSDSSRTRCPYSQRSSSQRAASPPGAAGTPRPRRVHQTQTATAPPQSPAPCAAIFAALSSTQYSWPLTICTAKAPAKVRGRYTCKWLNASPSAPSTAQLPRKSCNDCPADSNPKAIRCAEPWCNR